MGSGTDSSTRRRPEDPLLGHAIGGKPLRYRTSKNDQHEKEGGHSFEGHAGSNRKVARQFGSAEGNSAPGVIGNGGLEDEGRNDSAHELRRPIQEGFDGVQPLGDPNADGHGGIEMSAGNVAHCGDHEADGEAVREGDGEEADAAGAAQILSGANRAGAKENQGKGADKFRDEFLRKTVHGEFLPSRKGKRARFRRLHSSRSEARNASPGGGRPFDYAQGKQLQLTQFTVRRQENGIWKKENGDPKI